MFFFFVVVKYCSIEIEFVKIIWNRFIKVVEVFLWWRGKLRTWENRIFFKRIHIIFLSVMCQVLMVKIWDSGRHRFSESILFFNLIKNWNFFIFIIKGIAVRQLVFELNDTTICEVYFLGNRRFYLFFKAYSRLCHKISFFEGFFFVWIAFMKFQFQVHPQNKSIIYKLFFWFYIQWLINCY